MAEAEKPEAGPSEVPSSTELPWVLLHGFSGAGRSWRAVREFLPSTLEVWAPDLPGHGKSAAVRPPTFEAILSLLAAELEGRFAGRAVHLVGYSLGGRLALGLALRHRARVARLSLIGTRPGISDSVARHERAAKDDALASRLLEKGLEPFVDAWQGLPLFASQSRHPSEALDEQRHLRLAQDPAALAWALGTASPGKMPDFTSELVGLDLPVHLIVGELDVDYVRRAKVMAAALPQSRLTVIPDCGHNPLLEAPAALSVALTGALTGALDAPIGTGSKSPAELENPQ